MLIVQVIFFSRTCCDKHIKHDRREPGLFKYRRVLDDAVNIASTNRGLRTINHQILTYEQTKK